MFRVHLYIQYYWLGDKAAFSDVQQSKGYVDKRDKTIGHMKTCGSSMLKLCLHEVQAIREGRRKRREVQAGVERCPKM